MQLLRSMVFLLATFVVAQSDGQADLWIFGGGRAGRGVPRVGDVRSLTLEVPDASWVSRPSMKFPRKGPAIIRRADGYIYAMDNESAEKIDPNNATAWIPGPWTFITGSQDGPHILGEINGVVYVYRSFTVSTKFEKWNFTEHKYTSIGLAQPQFKQSDACGALLGGKLYLTGGKSYEHYGKFKSIQIYDAATNTWSVSPKNMTYGHESCAATVLDGKLYVCGGERYPMGECRDCEVMDAATGEWSAIAAMRKVRSAFTLVAHNHKLIALGGAGQGTIESYDLNTNKWTLWDLAMPSKQEYGVGAVVVENQ